MLQPSGRFPFFVLYARKYPALFFNSFLIQSKKGNKPRCLQDEDGSYGNGTADAERL
jgi:hypothetical protein